MAEKEFNQLQNLTHAISENNQMLAKNVLGLQNFLFKKATWDGMGGASFSHSVSTIIHSKPKAIFLHLGNNSVAMQKQ